MERLKNTLGIKEMKIVESVGYFDQYIGKPMVFWVGNGPIYYSIDSLTEVKIVPLESCVAVVFFGSSNDIKFAVDMDHGFGFREKGAKDHIWVDKMNETEMAIIVYEPEGGDEKKEIRE
jgi:hypothetical protein